MLAALLWIGDGTLAGAAPVVAAIVLGFCAALVAHRWKHSSTRSTERGTSY
jgi:hypothetical protein